MNIPRMSYPQYRKARRLTHECCNYCNGNCLLLDDGEECVCVQSISYPVPCLRLGNGVGLFCCFQKTVQPVAGQGFHRPSR